MKQPLGYEDKELPQHVCKLNKALYGLKQAPRAWYAQLSSKLSLLGFIPSKADMSLFIFNQEGVTIYLLVYVDDIIITSSSPQAVPKLVQQLQKDFALKYLGNLNYFLGLEIRNKSNGIVLHQSKYIADLWSHMGMSKCKPSLMRTSKLQIQSLHLQRHIHMFHKDLSHELVHVN